MSKRRKLTKNNDYTITTNLTDQENLRPFSSSSLELNNNNNFEFELNDSTLEKTNTTSEPITNNKEHIFNPGKFSRRRKKRSAIFKSAAIFSAKRDFIEQQNSQIEKQKERDSKTIEEKRKLAQESSQSYQEELAKKENDLKPRRSHLRGNEVSNNFVKLNLRRKSSRNRTRRRKRKRSDNNQNFENQNDSNEECNTNSSEDAYQDKTSDNRSSPKQGSSKSRTRKRKRSNQVKNKKHDNDIENEDHIYDTDDNDDKENEIRIKTITNENISSLIDSARSNLISLSDQLMDQILTDCFGFSSFRKGQRECIRRILSNQSTLMILPTGGGKSLCYQYPALLMPHFCIVVTPLISLMSDQLKRLPECLSGALLKNTQSSSQMEEIYENVRNGSIKVLYVSPERLNSEHFLRVLDSLPPISFVCIDEAHCISEWSHNFRPSYLHLREIIQDRLQVSCILGLTATATYVTENSICSSLGINSLSISHYSKNQQYNDNNNNNYNNNKNNSVIRLPAARSNLNLSVSRDLDRFAAIIRMLKTPRFESLNSIIIYTMRQRDADDLSNHLKMNGFDAISYHAGLSASQRQSRQNKFMKNRVRIITATVAFGMGIDKHNVRAVIHFNMPRSLENYVQEVGRAGRDGEDAQCHLFFHNDDYLRLRSLAYSDGVDDSSLKFLLQRLFDPDQAPSNLSLDLDTSPADDWIPYQVALSQNDIELNLDIKREVVSTILSYLELHENNYLRVLPQCFCKCNIEFIQTEPSILARSSFIVSRIWNRSRSIPRSSKLQFPVMDVARDMNLSYDELLKQLNNLRDQGECLFDLDDPGFLVMIHRYPDKILHLCRQVSSRLQDLEDTALNKLNVVYKVMRSVSVGEYKDIGNDLRKVNEQTQGIVTQIDEYFTKEQSIRVKVPSNQPSEDKKKQLEADIKRLVRDNEDRIKSGRVIARILHGVPSPAFPIQEWGYHRMWGKCRHISFQFIREIATQIIMEHRRKQRMLS